MSTRESIWKVVLFLSCFDMICEGCGTKSTKSSIHNWKCRKQNLNSILCFSFTSVWLIEKAQTKVPNFTIITISFLLTIYVVPHWALFRRKWLWFCWVSALLLACFTAQVICNNPSSLSLYLPPSCFISQRLRIIVPQSHFWHGRWRMLEWYLVQLCFATVTSSTLHAY